MPIYEFHCNQCERESEILVRSTDWTGTVCPHCGSTQLVKKLSVFASSIGNEREAEAPACAMNQGGCCCCGGGGSHSH